MSALTVQRENKAKDIVSAKIKQIEVLTGDKKKASAYGSALMNLASNRNLTDCSVESVLDVGFQIVQAGLNPNPLFGQAYVVPFKIKGKNGNPDFTVAQLNIGYKGWISLGYRNGWVFRAVPVYKCDDFDIEFGGFEDVIHLKPNFDERDESNGNWVHKNLIGVVVYAKDAKETIFTEFVSFKKLEKMRMKSQNQNNPDKLDHIWLDWAEEMYKGKAIKSVVTRLPINDQIMEMAQKEDEPLRATTVEATPSQQQPVKQIDLNLMAQTPPAQDAELVPEKEASQKDNLFFFFSSRGVKNDEMVEFLKWAKVYSDDEESIKTFLSDMSGAEAMLEQFFENRGE